MANTSYNRAEVELKVNTESAKKEFDALTAKAKELRSEFAKAMNAGDAEGVRKTAAELKKVDAELRKMQTNASNIRSALENLDKATPKELRQVIKDINAELNSGRVERGTQQWAEYTEKLKEAKKALADVNEELSPDKDVSLLDKIKDGINGWGATAAAGAAAFAGVVMSGREAVQAYADMQAEEANVRKYTGMTEEQVRQLNDAFKEMDTRTSREELNQMAQEAGRLGKQSIEDVLGYVKAADVLKVALDDLGDDATLTLSKLTGIFGIEGQYGTEQSLLKVGSVINDLSQNCSASAPYLAEFASRLGGIAAQSKMTVQQVMAFGAVLDTQNMNVEAASTALGQLIAKMYKDPAMIAKAAGLKVKEFSDLVRTDMNQALITLFETLKDKGGMESLASVFDEMGTDGARATPVLSALAGHIEELKAQQVAANEAFREGTSVGREFEVQNTTVQAQLDKAKKGFNEMVITLGEKLVPVMSKCISGTSMLMRVMSVLVTFISEHYKALITLGVGYATYATWMARATIAQKAHTIAGIASNTVLKAKNALIGTYNIVMAASQVVIAGATNALAYFRNGLAVTYDMQVRARTAQIALNNAIKANPFGLLLSIISMVVTALIAFSGESEEAQRATKALADAEAQAAEKAKEEELALKKNIETVKEFNGTKEEEAQLIEMLNNKYGTVFGTYKTLADWQRVLTKNGKDYIDIIRAQIKIEAIQEAARALYAEAARKRSEGDSLSGDDIGFWDSVWRNIKDSGGSAAVGLFTNKSKEEQAEEDRQELYRQADKAEQQYEDLMNQADELQADLDNKTGALKDNLDTQVNEFLYESNEEYRKRWDKISSDWAKSLKSGSGHAFVDENNRFNAQQQRDQAFRELNREYAAQSVVTDNIPTSPSAPTALSDKDRRKLEAEKKKREAAAKKALKEDMEAAKAERTRNETENNAAYRLGEKNYLEFTNRKAEIEANYIADSKKLLEDRGLTETEKYAKLLKQEEKMAEESSARKLRASIHDLDLARKKAQDEANDAYFDPSSPMFNNDKALKEALLKADTDYLTAKRDLYAEGSEEWIKADEELSDRMTRAQLDKKKELADLYSKYLKEYATSDDRMALEKNVLDELHEAGLLSEEKYQEALAKLKQKYVDKDKKKREEIKSEYADMVLNLVSSFKSLFDNLGKGGTDMWDSIADAAAAAYAVMSAGLQQYSAYANAERDLELAKVEQRYKDEEEAAGNNSAQKAKLEKRKEAEVAAIKKKYNDRAMRIEMAQAVASTALAAINAYASASKVNFILGPIAAAMATAAGMIQIATIKKQHEAEAVGYYTGGFTRRDPDNRREAGVVHANEFVANHTAVANPSLLPVLRLIDHAQRTNTVGALTADDVSRAIGAKPGVSARGGGAVRGAATSDAVVASTSAMTAVATKTEAAITRLTRTLDGGIDAVVILDGERGLYKKYNDYSKRINGPKR